MPATVVVGAQWGDEGKGKIIDLLAEYFRCIIRFNGGPNAGHTLVYGDMKLATHLVPSGVLYSGKTLVLGQGMAIDPEVLCHEIESLLKVGLLDRCIIMVDYLAHVILPAHKERDAQTGDSIGTTKRGVGPCYEDRVGRRGVRIFDLLNYKHPYYVIEMNKLSKWDFVQFTDTSRELHEALSREPHPPTMLFEGAQGVMLDVEYGTYPFVTSSHTLAQNAMLSCGLSSKFLKRVIGVTKAYTTRVGKGPFPTELVGKEGDDLRARGNEFGATTGRPRRCGWLDIPQLRYAIRVSGIDVLAMTKLDILSDLEIVKICVGYRVGDRTFDELSPILRLDEVEPIYEELPGWKNFGSTKNYFELPGEAKRFIEHVEELLGIKIVLISYGPQASETLVHHGAKYFID